MDRAAWPVAPVLLAMIAVLAGCDEDATTAPEGPPPDRVLESQQPGTDYRVFLDEAEFGFIMIMRDGSMREFLPDGSVVLHKDGSAYRIDSPADSIPWDDLDRWDEVPGPDATTVEDSAGILIVTSERPLWDADSEWTVIPEPVLSIGDDSPLGDSETDILFGSIRSMAVLPSGRVAVGDERSAVVSVFDSDGELVHRFGGRGEGPGEVGGIRDLHGCAGDTVIVRFRTELSFFGGNGEFIRRINSVGAGTTWALEAIAPDCGQFIASRSADATIPRVGQDWLRRKVVVRTDDAFVVTDTIAWEVSGEMFTAWLEGGEIPVVLPWTPVNSNVELRDGQLIAGFGRWAEFRVYSREGGHEQWVRWNPARDPVTPADRDRYTAKRSEFVARYGDSPLMSVSFPALRELPRVPSHKPFFDGFLVDDAGNFWARHFPSTGLGIQDLRPPRDPAPPETWTVLDSAGVWLGPVHLPDGFAAHEVANDRVYGVHTSPLGTQTVRVYRLVRGN